MTLHFTEDTFIGSTKPKKGEEYWLIEITRAYDDSRGVTEMWSHGEVGDNQDRELALMRTLCAVEDGESRLAIDPELMERAWTHVVIHSIKHDGISLLSSVCVPYRSGTKDAISAMSRLWADVTGDKDLGLPSVMADLAIEMPTNACCPHHKTTEQDPRGVAEILDHIRVDSSMTGWALTWTEKDGNTSKGATKVWDCNPLDDSLKAFLDEINPQDVKLYRIKSGKMLLKSKWFSDTSQMDKLLVWHGIIKDVKTEMRRCLN